MLSNKNKIIIKGEGVSRTIHSKVIQSPLSGISDEIFRALIRKWSPNSLLFCEMLKASLMTSSKKRKYPKKITKEDGPLGIQLYDFRPNIMAEAAIKAEASGAFLIDINMGCPVKKITKQGGGSSLLRDEVLAEKIVHQVSQSVSIPVTVKMRLGWCEKTSNPIDFACRMQDAGAKLITIHGRTRSQGFKGIANWKSIREVKENLEIPIIANGDITSPEDAIRCLEITKANGIMIGRGSMGRPWLIGQINNALNGEKIFKDPSPTQKLQLIHGQIIEMTRKYGDHGILISRKYLKWYCKDFDGANELIKKLLKIDNAKELLDLIEEQINLVKDS